MERFGTIRSAGPDQQCGTRERRLLVYQAACVAPVLLRGLLT